VTFPRDPRDSLVTLLLTTDSLLLMAVRVGAVRHS
jgi:hypothetical protein